MVKVKRLPDEFHPPYYDLDGYYLSLASAGTAKTYVEGTFTPTISFGGASVGVTYSPSTEGFYTKIGRIILFSARVRLTAKGSSTGAAVIGGLPTTTGSRFHGATVGFYNNMSGLTGAMQAMLDNALVNTITLRQSAATANPAITNTSFTDTSDVIVSGFYDV